MDFVQTMKDWRRMCRYMDKEYGNSSCEKCPLGGCNAIYEMCGKENFTDMEHDISTWAAEHPEPVYPSWVEWLYEQGLMTDVIDGKGGNFLYNLASKPIPADIAQKLGLQPKEG